MTASLGIDLMFVFASGIIGLLYAAYKAWYVKKQDAGDEKMREVASYIRQGAMAYLRKQYSILGIVTVFVAIALYFILAATVDAGFAVESVIAFVLGAVGSALAGYVGMNVATLTNVRTTNAAKEGMGKALKVSFSSGMVMALFTTSIALLGIAGLYYFFVDPEIVISFALGGALVALFARVGGGIYTKAADVGADLVGKVEQHIPEDDPRNPAVIADNVGDNVGDIAGMGADLFESYLGALIAAMAIGVFAFSGNGGVLFPMVLGGAGIFAAIIASFFVRTGKNVNIHNSFQYGLIGSNIIVAVVGYFLIQIYFTDGMLLFWTLIVGLATGILIGLTTDRYTSEKGKYVKSIAEAAESGVAPTMIQGLVVGMRSTKNVLILVAASILLSFLLGGLYGIAIASVAMLSTLGISLAVDAFGPVVDNAGGIAEMTNQPESIRKITDELDAAGNTTAAMGKGFAIGSAALTSLALFTTYASTAGLQAINMVDPTILIGLFIGAMLPFYFASQTMSSVGKAALAMVAEVRRQFKEIPGLLTGKEKPDYKRCVDISTGMALREMIAPGMLSIIVPIVFGLFLGVEALGGLLVGSLLSGAALAIMMSTSGGAWDNAKKLVEAKKEDTPQWHSLHDATVVGDTVGDPFKDTSGPALNILIKLMIVVALIFIPFIAKYNPIIIGAIFG